MTPVDLIVPAQAKYLPNGLKYIYHADNSNPVLCLQLYIKVGSAWESSAESGYSHFLEHLTFKSTKHFGYNQISRVVSNLGGSINAYTDFDCTCYYILLPSEYLFEGLHILSEIAIFPSFTVTDVSAERDIILEEVKQYDNDPELEFLEYIQKTCFDVNPLRNPVLGTLNSIRSASRAKLNAFHTKYYQPNNSLLVLTGDFDTDKLSENIVSLFGQWENTGSINFPDHLLFMEPEIPPYKEFVRRKEQDYVAFVLPELSESHKDSDSLQIAMRYLAVGKSSRLFKRLVETEHLCSSVKVNSLCGQLSGVSAIVINPIHAKYIPQIQRVFAEEWTSLLKGIIDPIEVNLVKKDTISSWRFGFEGAENLANSLGAEDFISGFEGLYDYDQRIRSVDSQDVLRAIAKYWQPRYLVYYQQSKVSASTFHPDSFERQTNPISIRSELFPDYSGLSLIHHIDTELIELEPGYFYQTLANGLKFIYRHLPRQPICGFALSTDICQLNEKPEQRGLNFLCSTAMLHSTASHSYSEIMNICREHGFNIGLEHHLDSTIFYGKCFHSELTIALSLLKELITQPIFDPHYLNLIRISALDSLRRDKQNPSSYAYQRWFRMLFGPNSPYDKYSGEIADLKHHKRDAVLSWYEDKYDPCRFSLAVVGSADPHEVLDLVSSLFATISPKDACSPQISPLPHSGKLHKIVQKRNTEQSIIHMGGFATPAQNKLQTTAFHLLAHIIGGDMDSRFFNILREKYAFSYQTGFDYTSINQIGYWNAYAYCDREDYKQCFKLMQSILADIVQHGVESSELIDAQNYLCGMNRFEKENVTYQAAMMANLSSLDYDPDFYLQREQRIRSIDLGIIQDIAKTWLQPDNQFTHILI